MHGKRPAIAGALTVALCAFALVFTLGIEPVHPVDETTAQTPSAALPASDETSTDVVEGATETSAASNENATQNASSTSRDSSDSHGGSPNADAHSPEAPPEIYQPGYVLADIPSDLSADQAAQELADRAGLEGIAVEVVTDRYVKFALPDGVSVEDAVERMNASGVAYNAQPNFAYHTLEPEVAAESAEGASATASAAAQAAADAELRMTAAASTVDLIAGTPTGDAFGIMASLNDYYYRNGDMWWLDSVNALTAWDSVSPAATPITVAVVDEGFALKHEDLTGNYTLTSSGSSVATVVAPYNVTTKTTDVSNYVTHGTHVAGIVAAHANNNLGVAGITNNLCRIMPVKVADAQGYMYSDYLISGVDYVVDNASKYNVRVMNFSLGIQTNTAYDGYMDGKFATALKDAYEQGIITVAAAGNESNSTTPPFFAYPAEFDRVVSVINLQEAASVADGLLRASSSNYNHPGELTKDISAPGTYVLSTYQESGTKYAYQGGTSMAAPVVSGILALELTASPGLTADEAVSKLYSTAVDLKSSANSTAGWDEGTGYGKADAAAAVSRASAYLSGSTLLAAGETVQYAVKVNGAVQSGWAFSSSDTDVLGISSDGKAVGGSGGTVIVMATEGSAHAYQTVVVRGSSISGPSVVRKGLTAVYSINTELRGSWTWTSSDEGLATIDADSGKLTAIGKGTVILTATYQDDPSIFLTKTVKIASTSLSDGEMTVDNLKSLVYTGKALKQANLVVKDGAGIELAEGKDYTAEYRDNVYVGTASIILRGIGVYEGSMTVNFNIVQASLSQARVTFAPSYALYTGSAQSPAITVTYQGKTLVSGVDYKVVRYANNVNIGQASVYLTALNKNFQGGTYQTYFYIRSAVQYLTHIQTYGWEKSYAGDGAVSGTTGQAKRLEAIRIKLPNKLYSGGIQYRTHVQSYGWQGWVSNDALSGTSGQAKRLEAIQIQLTGEMANRYDVYYCVHAQKFGWMGWAKNGASAGTAGYGYRLEAIRIRLVAKGTAAPAALGSTRVAYQAPAVQYRTHVQTYGWQSYVYDGAVSGTTGKSKRLEAINLSLSSASGISGGIRYKTHVQTYGWQDWRYNGALSGTSGQAKRLEAIQIQLTGNAASRYDVYYRVHAQKFGWMGWAKNGESAGTAGYAYRLEGIQVKLVPKGGAAPGTTANAFRQKR